MLSIIIRVRSLGDRDAPNGRKARDSHPAVVSPYHLFVNALGWVSLLVLLAAFFVVVFGERWGE